MAEKRDRAVKCGRACQNSVDGVGKLVNARYPWSAWSFLRPGVLHGDPFHAVGEGPGERKIVARRPAGVRENVEPRCLRPQVDCAGTEFGHDDRPAETVTACRV